MEMKENIRRTLKQTIDGFPFRKFFLPDGKAKIEHHFSIQPYVRLILILSGIKREPMSLNGKRETVTLHPGDYYLIRREVWEYTSFSTEHEFLCLIPRNTYLRLVHYRISGKPAGNGENLFESEWYHTPGLSAPLQHAFDALSLLEESRREPDLCKDLVRAILRLSLQEMQKEILHAGKSNMTFEAIREFVETHCSEPISRNDAAQYFRLNPSYISQLFRRKSNGTFQEYLLKCRIAKARFLLSETTLPVKAIAEECGWSDDVYFIRQFHRQTGLPPGKFRLINRTKRL